jgi:hypothetical protein
MAQTTGAISFKAVKVEICATGTSTWTDISGTSNKVSVSGPDRASGEAYTAAGDNPILTAGKLGPVEVTVDSVYSEVTGEAFKVLWDLHVAVGGSDIWARWTPKGTTTGDYRFTSGKGIITKCPPPQGDVGDGKPVMFGFTIKAASLTQATAA